MRISIYAGRDNITQSTLLGKAKASNGDGYKTRSILANTRKQTRWNSGQKTGESISVSSHLHSKTGPICGRKSELLLRRSE
jgi:hypothetical protein